MLIKSDTMNKIHNIQLEMLRELILVMNRLEIKYYFVHGSLLGAITKNNFILEDDDIDIAIFRKDYIRLLNHGNDFISNKYFIQNSINDDFPLPFAKMRYNSSAFIQPVLAKCKCNKGIYIDIFPIDFIAKKNINTVVEKILSHRIQLKLNQKNFLSFKSLIIKAILYILLPSYKKAVLIRERIYSSRKRSDYISVTGGKSKERKLPLKWFDKAVKMDFCGISINCPLFYEDYLKTIYGLNYMEHNPAKDRIKKEGYIEISAEILDFEKSYKYYEI